jgi:hypothetical protein
MTGFVCFSFCFFVLFLFLKVILFVFHWLANLLARNLWPYRKEVFGSQSALSTIYG